mmetsp:Transcript_13114/g.37770  ORF Transcript_13114/g.37770 Transcript_13114/m.37770 type:complete len:338 (-) Transcript_13114:474-1487(-)
MGTSSAPTTQASHAQLPCCFRSSSARLWSKTWGEFRAWCSGPSSGRSCMRSSSLARDGASRPSPRACSSTPLLRSSPTTTPRTSLTLVAFLRASVAARCSWEGAGSITWTRSAATTRSAPPCAPRRSSCSSTSSSRPGAPRTSRTRPWARPSTFWRAPSAGISTALWRRCASTRANCTTRSPRLKPWAGRRCRSLVSGAPLGRARCSPLSSSPPIACATLWPPWNTAWLMASRTAAGRTPCCSRSRKRRAFRPRWMCSGGSCWPCARCSASLRTRRRGASRASTTRSPPTPTASNCWPPSVRWPRSWQLTRRWSGRRAGAEPWRTTRSPRRVSSSVR